MHITISGRNVLKQTDAIPSSGTVSAGLTLPGLPILGLLVPVLTAATITFEISLDGGTSWVPLKQNDGTTDAIAIQGGASAFAVSSEELGPLAAYTGQLRDVEASDQIKVRFKSSVAQGAIRTFTWILMG